MRREACSMGRAALTYECPACGVTLPVEVRRRRWPSRKLRFSQSGWIDLWAHTMTHEEGKL